MVTITTFIHSSTMLNIIKILHVFIDVYDLYYILLYININFLIHVKT